MQRDPNKFTVLFFFSPLLFLSHWTMSLARAVLSRGSWHQPFASDIPNIPRILISRNAVCRSTNGINAISVMKPSNQIKFRTNINSQIGAVRLFFDTSP
ncbi:hypothetical protein OXX69_004532 [Metschnikowia pulcherrima]